MARRISKWCERNLDEIYLEAVRMDDTVSSKSLVGSHHERDGKIHYFQTEHPQIFRHYNNKEGR